MLDPRVNEATCSWVTLPTVITRYRLVMPYRGWVSLRLKSPSLVRNSPSLS